MGRRLISIMLSLALLVVMGSVGAVSAFAADKTGKCSCDVLNVRSGAGTEYSKVGQITEGQTVTIIGSAKDSEGGEWYKISAGDLTGYCASNYIDITSSAQSQSASVSQAAASGASSADFEAYMTAQGFPESYKPYLRTMHSLHPNWVFTAQQLGVDWNTAVTQECVLGRNLVHDGAPDSWKSMEKGAYNYDEDYWYGLDGWYWQAASKQIIMYYMDPRNFINDTYIFMFENLSYDPSYQTEAGVKKILEGTFMSGNYTCPDTGETKSYSGTFMEAAKLSGVSPYHLASRCRNEQGVYGAPQSLGTVEGFEDYFNFFDVMAYATSTMSAAEMGCKYAKTENPTYMLPWTNQYKSIVGGSIFVGNGYITKGQDTLYLQKFDMVDGGNGLYYHQYMTCVFGQANEAVSLKNAYSDQIKSGAMEFKIPVYNNMPDSACSKPTDGGNSNSYLKTLSVSGVKLSPAFAKGTYSYTATVPDTTSSVTITAISEYDAADVSGFGSVQLKTGANVLRVICTAENGTSSVYTITITRQAPAKAAPAYAQGDTDGDGNLTVIDALMISRHVAGRSLLNTEQKTRADYNADTKISIADALFILKKVSGRR